MSAMCSKYTVHPAGRFAAGGGHSNSVRNWKLLYKFSGHGRGQRWGV